jgi:hypothetical protein
MFHRWAALAGCGHVLGRKVWNVRAAPGGFAYGIFPGQIMVCLVAASALLRKSTALDAMGRLLQDLPAGITNLLPQRTSPQELMRSLQPRDDAGDPLPERDCVGLIMASELGAFFSSEGFLETMATHVTRLNDAPHGRYDPEGRRFRDHLYPLRFIKWQLDLLNPCVGMLAATTPTGLAKELPVQAQTAGLFGRMLTVHQSDTDRAPNALTIRPSRQETLRVASLEEALLEGLQKMAALAGEIPLSRQARLFFDAWYREHVAANRRAMAASAATSGYVGRKADHAIRVAMVLTAMEAVVGPWPPESVVVKEGHLRTALSWLRALEPGMERAFAETILARRTTIADTILAYLTRPRQRGKWVARRQIQQRVWYKCQNRREFRDALESLVEVGKVRARDWDRNSVQYRARKGMGSVLAGMAAELK